MLVLGVSNKDHEMNLILHIRTVGYWEANFVTCTMCHVHSTSQKGFIDIFTLFKSMPVLSGFTLTWRCAMLAADSMDMK